MKTVDLSSASVRDLNQALHDQVKQLQDREWRVTHPDGAHNLAGGVNEAISIDIQGHAGYYCAGMNQKASITVHGNVGVGCAENMMSGAVRVKGSASQAAGATAHGGLLVIEGDAGARCGISMKGIDIVVGGSIGHMSCFMGQAGRLVVC
ncbi:protein glxC, partial [Pseudomonas syringae]